MSKCPPKTPCDPSKICNPPTGKCVLKTGAIGKLLVPPSSASPASPADSKMNETKQCPPCHALKLCNPQTGKCVLRTGVVGKKVLALFSQTPKPAAPQTPKPAAPKPAAPINYDVKVIEYLRSFKYETPWVKTVIGPYKFDRGPNVDYFEREFPEGKLYGSLDYQKSESGKAICTKIQIYYNGTKNGTFPVKSQRAAIIKFGRLIMRVVPKKVNIQPWGIIDVPIILATRRGSGATSVIPDALEAIAEILDVPSKDLVDNALAALETALYVDSPSGLAFQALLKNTITKKTFSNTGRNEGGYSRFRILENIASMVYRRPIPYYKERYYSLPETDTEMLAADLNQKPAEKKLLPRAEWQALFRQRIEQLAGWFPPRQPRIKVIKNLTLDRRQLGQLVKQWTGGVYSSIRNERSSSQKMKMKPEDYKVDALLVGSSNSVHFSKVVDEALARYMRNKALRAPQTPPGQERPRYLYRGMEMEEKPGERFMETGYLNPKGYIATSYDIVIASSFGLDPLLEFDLDLVPAGTPWIWFKGHSKAKGKPQHRDTVVSLSPEEKEVLLPPSRIVLVPKNADVSAAVKASKKVALGSTAGWTIDDNAVLKRVGSFVGSLADDASAIATLMDEYSYDQKVRYDWSRAPTLWLTLALAGATLRFQSPPGEFKESKTKITDRFGKTLKNEHPPLVAMVVPDRRAASLANPSSPIVKGLHPALNSDTNNALETYQQLSTLFETRQTPQKRKK